MAARNTFIGALARTLEAAAPKQLTFNGAEGFFAAGETLGVKQPCWLGC